MILLHNMKIYTTKSAIMIWEWIKRTLLLKLIKLWVIKTVVNQKGKKIGYYLVR